MKDAELFFFCRCKKFVFATSSAAEYEETSQLSFKEHWREWAAQIKTNEIKAGWDLRSHHDRLFLWWFSTL